MGSVSVWLHALPGSVLGIPLTTHHAEKADVYYIIPHSPNPNCPSGEPCLTINE